MRTIYDLKSSLPTHCQRVAEYWATLVCFEEYASGKAAAMKYKSVRAFYKGLIQAGLSEEIARNAYVDTLAIARLIKRAHDNF